MLTCYLCKATVADRDTAIDTGWEPDFWVGNTYHSEPVCRECAGLYLIFEENGERVLRSAPSAEKNALSCDQPYVING